MNIKLNRTRLLFLKALLHLLAFLPLVWAVYAIRQGTFGADPGKELQHFTGITTLKLLIATLVVSPLSRWLKQPLLMRVRRLVGLWCFCWACLHFASYYLLELGIGNLSLLGSELVRRPYLTLGILGWFILLLLSITSFQRLQSKLGKHWQRLHNLIYPLILLGCIHYLWSVKTVSPQPVIYLFIGVLLLLLRYKKFVKWFK